jgi:penicillin amidase
MSWGLTNAFLPTAQVSFVDEKELASAPSFRPLIWVKVWKIQVPFFFKTFQRTASHLPVLPIPNTPPGKAIVLKWTGFDLKPKDFVGMTTFMSAKNVNEMNEALSRIGIPSWNFNFADDRGNIGYRAIGRIYRPDHKNAFAIPTRTLSEVETNSEFSHPLTPDEMPHLLNPTRGFIANGNNTHWPQNAPFSSGRAPYAGFRAFRIEELLKSTPQHDLESNRKIQCDVETMDARFLLPKLLSQLKKSADFSEQEKSALALLKSWDYQTPVECQACGIYRAWVNAIYSTEKLNIQSLYRILERTEQPDQQQRYPQFPQLQERINTAFVETVADLTHQGTQPFPKWGKIHLNFFRHLAGPQFEKTDPLGTSGDEFTVNPGTENDPEHPFEHTDGASQRLVVQMTSPPQVYAVLPGTNLDVPTTSLTQQDSPWLDWAQCRLVKKNFPVDWATVRSKTKLEL